MADNREHKRDSLKHVRIVRPPFAHLADGIPGGCEPVPSWVSEACVGLIFDPMELVPEGDAVSTNPDYWILALMNQDPQELSNMAALWMHYNVHWAGNISTLAENVEILGKGRLLEKNQECYLPTIHMKLAFRGSSCVFVDGDVGDVDEYEIVELIGRRLPPLQYEHAPLPMDVPRMDMGMSEWDIIHDVGSTIDEDAIRALKDMGVEVTYTGRGY